MKPNLPVKTYDTYINYFVQEKVGGGGVIQSPIFYLHRKQLFKRFKGLSCLHVTFFSPWPLLPLLEV